MKRRLTNIVHGVVRRVQAIRGDAEDEEPSERALAPLQLWVCSKQRRRLDVRRRRGDVGPERGGRRNRRTSELDAERAFARRGIVRRRVVRDYKGR